MKKLVLSALEKFVNTRSAKLIHLMHQDTLYFSQYPFCPPTRYQHKPFILNLSISDSSDTGI